MEAQGSIKENGAQRIEGSVHGMPETHVQGPKLDTQKSCKTSAIPSLGTEKERHRDMEWPGTS